MEFLIHSVKVGVYILIRELKMSIFYILKRKC